MDEAGGSRVWAAPCMKWVQTDAQGLAGLWGGGYTSPGDTVGLSYLTLAHCT